jgi:hypothetical protein
MKTATVKQIHDELDAASDALYHEAVLNTAIDFNRIEKSKRLKRLGFTHSSECVKALGKEELSVYYRKKYPFLKFITRGQLEAICEKYGLIYAEVFNYIGEIPKKNLQEIEQAQPLDEEDKFDGDFIYKEMEKELKEQKANRRGIDVFNQCLYDHLFSTTYEMRVKRYAGTLFIAANKEFFDLENMKNVKGSHEYISAPKDPIVFRWCRGGILIISKWGAEANDPELTIPELN